MWHLFLLRLMDNNISHHILHVDVLWKHTLSSMLSSVFVTLELVSLGCRTGPVHELKVSALLCREAGRKRFFFFPHLRFSHSVTQFHAPLAYVRWRAMKSVQFWDFRGTVFWTPLRYVVILLSSPPDRLCYYVTVAKVKLC